MEEGIEWRHDIRAHEWRDHIHSLQTDIKVLKNKEPGLITFMYRLYWYENQINRYIGSF